ncbi:uncharacterized protein Tco025E_08411 [Trypanosoma conorhini]|uniref:Uncharacterized protein n=1 Tax=Trypanosoma conorhini TaxID=83891 RepID=A0A3R7MH52_9TRYP|nr:uncharacterized protein Tco025E_08411 [Trypanosoma conorhini]RNF02417.1 hypothetical protein Tco025E_08411 [Trypanosoma conorhini]
MHQVEMAKQQAKSFPLKLPMLLQWRRYQHPTTPPGLRQTAEEEHHMKDFRRQCRHYQRRQRQLKGKWKQGRRKRWRRLLRRKKVSRRVCPVMIKLTAVTRKLSPKKLFRPQLTQVIHRMEGQWMQLK